MVNDVLEKMKLHEKPPKESILKMRWVLEYRLDENEKKSRKARSVIFGYLDPGYENRPAASPTITRNTRLHKQDLYLPSIIAQAIQQQTSVFLFCVFRTVCSFELRVGARLDCGFRTREKAAENQPRRDA